MKDLPYFVLEPFAPEPSGPDGRTLICTAKLDWL